MLAVAANLVAMTLAADAALPPVPAISSSLRVSFADVRAVQVGLTPTRSTKLSAADEKLIAGGPLGTDWGSWAPPTFVNLLTTEGERPHWYRPLDGDLPSREELKRLAPRRPIGLTIDMTGTGSCLP